MPNILTRFFETHKATPFEWFLLIGSPILGMVLGLICQTPL